MKIKHFLFSLSLFLASSAYAQTDSLKLDIIKAEQLFLMHNFQLLAANYQVEQAKAAIITARLFDNPTLSYQNLFYNRETKKFFETSYATGQYAAEISQLIKLAGKRKKTIQLAHIGVNVAEIEYQETVRSLRFQLRDVFYRTYYNVQSANVYQQEIAGSEKLLQIYQQQLVSGNVAQKDVIRIQSLLIHLKAELKTLLNSIEDDYRNLKLLCNIPAATNIELIITEMEGVKVQQISYLALLDSAKINRADFRLANAALKTNHTQLKLQKAMAIPDIELSLSYDLKGNYPDKYTGLAVRVPIPLFDRNQGEIKKARIGIDAADTNIKMAEALITNEVYTSYQNALRSERQYEAIDPKFSSNFEQLMNGINKSFMERNINLIEFLDFYNSYKESVIQLNQLKYERLSNREEINFVTASNIFK